METIETVQQAQATALPQRPILSSEQEQSILSATRELIRCTILGRLAVYPDTTLAGAANVAVSGAFVSLKRGKHLRACCGGLHDTPFSLSHAVADAARHTALDDTRFPSISPTELDHLQMEVWILYTPQPVTARGEDRVTAVVTGGKHGLIAQRGTSRGLLLPGVALDYGWDSRRFLEQVCIKAGLHPSLWSRLQAASTFSL